MDVDARELLYLFSTIAQALAAMLGIGIIAIAYINEKKHGIEKRLWDLATTYWKSANTPKSELSDRGITTIEMLTNFIKMEERFIRSKNTRLHADIMTTLQRYESQPQVEVGLFRWSLGLVVTGMILSVTGIMFCNELASKFGGLAYAVVSVVIFGLAIVLFVLLITRSILPGLAGSATKK